LAVVSGPNRWRVTQLGFHYTGAIERHALDALALDSEWGSVRGKLAVGATAPFAAEGRIVFAGSEAARHAIATVVVGGDMTTLSLSGDGSVDDARATGAAHIAPFEARRLRDFELRVENVDLARFDAALPRTELQATLAGTGTDDGGVRGALTARNAIAGPWSAGRLPLVSLASGFAAYGELIELDGLDGAFGDAGRVTGAAAVDRGAATWRLSVRDLDLRRIVTDLRATRLAGAFAGRMRVDTADAEGEVSGDLRQADMALAFHAAVGRGVVDVRTFRA